MSERNRHSHDIQELADFPIAGEADGSSSKIGPREYDDADVIRGTVPPKRVRTASPKSAQEPSYGGTCLNAPPRDIVGSQSGSAGQARASEGGDNDLPAGGEARSGFEPAGHNLGEREIFPLSKARFHQNGEEGTEHRGIDHLPTLALGKDVMAFIRSRSICHNATFGTSCDPEG